MVNLFSSYCNLNHCSRDLDQHHLPQVLVGHTILGFLSFMCLSHVIFIPHIHSLLYLFSEFQLYYTCYLSLLPLFSRSVREKSVLHPYRRAGTDTPACKLVAHSTLKVFLFAKVPVPPQILLFCFTLISVSASSQLNFIYKFVKC